MPPWAIVIVNITAAMVYHAQLVLYHHTGKFIHPEPATGMEAQLGLSVGYVGLAGLFYFVDRHQPWLDMAIAAMAFFGILHRAALQLVLLRAARQADALSRASSWRCAAVSARCICSHAINLYAFVLAIVCTSFRISGTYVLFTIVRRRFNGNDWGIWAFLAALFAAHFVPGIAPHVVSASLSGTAPALRGGASLVASLPYMACAYMVARNFMDISRHYRELKPSAAA